MDWPPVAAGNMVRFAGHSLEPRQWPWPRPLAEIRWTGGSPGRVQTARSARLYKRRRRVAKGLLARRAEGGGSMPDDERPVERALEAPIEIPGEPRRQQRNG